MKRSVFAVLGVVAALLSVPTIALATHQGSRSQRLSRYRHHHVGRNDPGGYTGAGGATVTSYADGVLTIALSKGGSLTGNVTEGTHFICLPDPGQRHGRKATVRQESFRHGATGPSGPSGPSGPGGPSGPSGPRGSGGSGSGWGGRTGTQGGRPHDRHGNGGSWGQPPPPCDSSLLTTTASIQSADVVITPGGVEFTTIVLPAVQ